MKKFLAIILALTMVLTLAACGSSVPSSMMPSAWTDMINNKAASADYASKTTVTVTGTVGSTEVEATYSVAVEDDLASYTLTSANTEDADILAYLEGILVNGILSPARAYEILDEISAKSNAEGDDISGYQLLGEISYSEVVFADGDNTNDLVYTYNEDLTLATVTYTEAGTSVNSLTLTWG